MQVLETVTIQSPKFALYSNVTAKPYQSVDEMKTLLVEQVVSAVRWEETAKVCGCVGAWGLPPGPCPIGLGETPWVGAPARSRRVAGLTASGGATMPLSQNNCVVCVHGTKMMFKEHWVLTGPAA